MCEQAGERFSKATTEMLREAGWFLGRDVFGDLQLPSGFVIFPAAQRVLAEFGHLVMGRPGPGVEFARTRVVIDPMLALGEDDRFKEFEDLLHTTLYPLGEIGYGDGFLVIDEQGQVFINFEDLFFVDDTFDAALDNLLNGLRRACVVDHEGHW